MNSIKLNGNNDLEALRQTQRTEPIRESDENSIAPLDKTAASQPSDVIDVSDRATTIRDLVEKIGKLPVVRTDQVERLRPLVQAGKYRPKAEAIADAMLKNATR